MSVTRRRRDGRVGRIAEFSTSPPSYWHDARESDLENSPLPSNVKVGDDILLPTARAARRRSSGITRSDLQNLEHNIMVAMERQSMQVIEYVDTSLREVKLMIEELSTRLSSRASPLSSGQSLVSKQSTGRARTEHYSGGRPAPLAETSVRSGEEIEAEREPMEEESTGELPDDMFQPINSLDSGAGTGGVPWISPARSRTGGRISSASSGRPTTTWGMLRTPGTTGHHIIRLHEGAQDESDSDMNQNRSSEDEEEELPLTTSEEPSPTKPQPKMNTPGVQRMDTAVLCGTEKESASRGTRQVCSTENNACVSVDAGVKAVSQPLNHASTDVTKNSSCVSTELGGSQRSNVVIRRWITPPTRTTIRSHTAAAIRPSYGMAMTPPVLFPQYRLVSPIAAAASFTPPTGLARPPVQITQSVPLRRRYQQSPVTSTITRMGTQDWIPLPRP
ncbi:hypothetical protein FOZ60_013802 [Perkinsus olseni]|uniref:Uncharacterized protein n=1 Tax=Perkinsus olseni TaxID=32597 RepID=A0A7J6P943_PEROL|nr:hypothetical protein FOZ60_013802 [Perkinsus olseni]